MLLYVRKMKARSSLKQEFLEKWRKGLQIGSKSKEDSTILETKDAIKLSADVAIAATRNAGTRWRQALLCDVVSKNLTNKHVVEQILGYKLKNTAATTRLTTACTRRILRRGQNHRRRKRSRSRALRKLVPGGEEMDGVLLLQETLDYIVSLRAQVDVMRRLASIA
ncbi:transcription factor IBH1-like 1 [Salvia hispanica]|uniref:transcription factor IBH1-like 1 n=1 Tax=Salvia hispanica TaxID=49212 RepID=UPI0020092B63|nr:transcription factor IBH1-like 1 [Salvia hispanica]